MMGKIVDKTGTVLHMSMKLACRPQFDTAKTNLNFKWITINPGVIFMHEK